MHSDEFLAFVHHVDKVAEEGGAIVSSTEGKPDYISSPQSILAAAPGIYQQVLEQLK